MAHQSEAPSVVVAGGGTAGHIEPALAVAEALRDRHGMRVTALGTERGLEKDLVPARGFDLRMIPPVPVPRKLNGDLMRLPLRVRRAVQDTKQVLRDVSAEALVGFGGYVAAPAYLAAASLGLPFYVHEANAKAGLANKLGVRLGGTGFNAVSDSGMKGDVVGIPIRSSLSNEREGVAAERGRKEWGLDVDRSTVLVTGGSQGAVSLNKALAEALETITGEGIQVLHAYGKKNDAPQPQEHYVPLPFITDMAAAYAVADLIVCRSGAMTVAEVTAAELPAVYVPLPHGNGEQGLNAKEVIKAGAARTIADSELNGEVLAREVLAILSDPQQHQKMRRAAAARAENNAAEIIADRVAAALA
ncbi:undecaprenyldiphospho-muramoylpentapeptide beta-N-acetylglucosaminyltransferase [Corynebacterium lowii]|uniref:UDP-N-acetylglucosamine--N-acetylmuramyl-(pentapeptide) pyrophosphoryl-undecaprenol N-acetylglucosamine transferase n=1 Tax=Corynebacterium lowii TaxID=1544413 RepID=A0A0Q0UFE7_9CORY|nr:undecaprenyldiphospho-muramoylpentapeptide beta-N-acetylglucosaminyltransferase [Corynebacterium lowii]KQB86757.1 UDP-N-acetylglucosamine--N-acetylmuramyl-(pentapeptide) pyrophosphoryl-undecaprenol N-acetylglucosamine transferase [Corynebacterium lowii]MDP9851443.1 UDP-N-acetylglucosamine--N-acetylmuramyl-(pentapeptide) pyrophosphoryl-undecaprenol N-acetylglucosamine transferase [Corynebacterium lowii]